MLALAPIFGVLAPPIRSLSFPALFTPPSLTRRSSSIDSPPTPFLLYDSVLVRTSQLLRLPSLRSSSSPFFISFPRRVHLSPEKVWVLLEKIFWGGALYWPELTNGRSFEKLTPHQVTTTLNLHVNTEALRQPFSRTGWSLGAHSEELTPL